MKRVNIVSTAVVMGALVIGSFVSCKEREGVYNIEKGKGKISKVYYEHYGVYSTGKKSIIEKRLIEVWKWDKNKLMQIESKDVSGYPWALNFIYEGKDKKQVTKIECGDIVFNFYYDDKDVKLTKIELLDEQARPILNITVDIRSEDKISKLTYEQFRYTEEDKSLFDKMRPVMNIMLGNNVGETMLRNVEENVRMQKATKTEKITTQVELTYEGNNVSTEKRTLITESAVPVVTTAQYKYDNKSNPYHSAFCLIFDGYYTSISSPHPPINAYFASFSENNVTSYFVYRPNSDPAKPDIKIDSAEYVYKYNSDNFPTERDKVTFIPNQDTSKTYTEHIIYYFEYITK